MFINEYGNRDDPTVILLAPMMISGADLYGQMSPHFRGSDHILAPGQGGHGQAGAEEHLPCTCRRQNSRSAPAMPTVAIRRRIRRNTWKRSSGLSGGAYEQKDLGSVRADL